LRHLQAVIPTRHLSVAGAHSENCLADTTQSKTSKCGVYTVNDEERNLKIEVIDTPGFADSRGHEQDSLNLKEILRKAEQVGELHAVVMVVNGRKPIKDAAMREALSKLSNWFPDQILQNLVIVVSNTSASDSEFDLSRIGRELGVELQACNCFFMDNTLFTTDMRSVDDETYEDKLRAWRKCKASLNALTERLCTLQANSADGGACAQRPKRHSIPGRRAQAGAPRRARGGRAAAGTRLSCAPTLMYSYL
jgi:hypothetical protein